jgi:putative phage-type endonuclease
MLTTFARLPQEQRPMTLRRINVETDADWQAARRSGIGSSDAPLILDASPYGGAFDVYLEKIGEAPSRESSVAMRRGKLLEPLVAALYQERYPERTVSDPDGGLFRSTEWPYLLATPDRWVVHPTRGLGLLELKTTTDWQREEWADEPPLHVLVQVQHQLAVLRGQWASVGALIGDTFVAFDVDRDDDFIEKAWLPRAQAFWACVEARRVPPATGASLAALKQLYPTVRARVTVDLPPAALSWDLALAEAEAELHRWGAVRDTMKAQLLQALGDAEVGVLPDGSARWTRTLVERKAYEVAPSSYVLLKRKAAKAVAK